MSSRIWALPLIVAAAALISGSDQRPKFHGVHEGTEAASKLPYELMYSGAVPLSESEDGRALLEGCMEAYGGREHLAALKSFRLVHDMKSDVFAGGTVKRVVARGRRHRIEMPNGQASALDGNQAWERREDVVSELPQPRYRAELFRHLTLWLPSSLEHESFDEPRYGRRADDSLAYLYFDKPDSLLLIVGIDPESHLIRSSEGVIRQAEGNFVHINRFSGHKDFDGYIFPGQLVNISLGLEVGQSELTSVEINAEVDDQEFDLSHLTRHNEGR